jgi:hypothetical protein
MYRRLKSYSKGRHTMKNQLTKMLMAVITALVGIVAFETINSNALTFDTPVTDEVIHLGNKQVTYNHYNTIVQLQEAIDRHPERAATLPYQAPQDNNDGQSTYFAGHDKDYLGGCFENLKSMKVGNAITIKDSKKTSRTYYIYQMFEGLDDVDTWTKEQFQAVFRTEREQIVLQTCINDQLNLIVIAR